MTDGYEIATVALSKGERGLQEAGLLAQALIGGDPLRVEAMLAFESALAQRGIKTKGMVLHAEFKRRRGGANGELELLLEQWIDLRHEGAGRTYHQPPEDLGADLIEVVVEIDRPLGLERLQRLVDAAAMVTSDEALLSPLHNAVAACDQGRSSQANPVLAAFADQLVRCHLSSPQDAIAWLPLAAEECAEWVSQQRGSWCIDAATAASVMLASTIPNYCASGQAASETATWSECFVRHLTFAVLQLCSGDVRASFPVISKAVREGHADSLRQLASDLLKEAEKHRDLALDGPPDRMQFGHELFLAAPFALATRWLESGIRNFGNVDARHSEEDLQKETEAEELYARLCDGLAAQWLDWLAGRFRTEQAAVLAAEAAGDKLLVWQLLREGEYGLRRPRSVRPMLLGAETNQTRWSDDGG
jgi:hypothetical protein